MGGAEQRSAFADPVAGVRATRLERALDWAAALAPAPLRLATSCCGMAWAQGGDVFETLGSAPPAVSGRAADLLIVAGSVTRRQLPSLLELYERMCEPRWVIAWGACAISGGAYANYATISGLSRILPVDVVVPGCPPAPQALRDALLRLRSGEARRRRVASSAVLEQPIGGSIGEAGTARALVRSDSGRAVDGFESP
jgi:NADH-quinone oxidoreductase subunit B